jgi:FdhD protein
MAEAEARRVTYTGYYDAESRLVRGVVPTEAIVTLHVNGHPLVRLICTPMQLKDLALGFLFNEGLIEGLGDVAVAELCGDGGGVDIWLEHDIERPEVRTITSGCSGGTTFEEVMRSQHPVESGLAITPEEVTTLMERLSGAASLYRRTGGVHTAALAFLDREDPLTCVADDVGRHNTLDKIAGTCLREGRSTRGGVLLSSGRISSEMVSKAARMGAPVVISRTSPTSLSIELAQAWRIALIGYTRRRSFRVYTGEGRIIADREGSGRR